jgi:ATP-binding protein involved in chromosome partitioning
VLLGQVPIVQGIREGGDEGVPAVLKTGTIMAEAFLNVAKNTLRQIAVRNEMMEPTRIVNMGE